MTPTHSTDAERTRSDIGFCLALTAAFILAGAFAANAQAINTTHLCTFLQNYILGDTGKAIATLGVIAVAVGAAFGRITWGVAVLTAVGIAGLFGAASIASSLSGGYACAW